MKKYGGRFINSFIHLKNTNANSKRCLFDIIEKGYVKGNEFNVLMKYLKDESGGNIQENGTIEITSNSINCSSFLKYHVDYGNDNIYDSKGGIENATVCLGF